MTSDVMDNGKGFRFVTLWRHDKHGYGQKDKLTFILSKGTVLIREHHEYSFSFDIHGNMLIARLRGNHSDPGPLMNIGDWSRERVEGWYIASNDPVVVELKKILANEVDVAIDKIVLGGI